MSLLRDLSPSECLVLLPSKQFGLGHHILFTVLDLVMRECIHLKVDNQTKAISIVKGTYSSKSLTPHERMLMGYIHKVKYSVTINQLLYLICYELQDLDSYLNNYVTSSAGLETYLKSNFWSNFKSTYTLNKLGKEMQAELLKELTTVQSGLTRTQKLNSGDLKYLFSIDANVFMVQDDLFKSAKEWKHNLAKNGVPVDVMKRFKHKFYVWENYISLRNLFIHKYKINSVKAADKRASESSGCSDCSSCSGCGGCSW